MNKERSNLFALPIHKEPDSYMQQSSEVHLTISIKLLVQLELVGQSL